MAGGSLLALFDDIVSILDDVSTMSKVALEKTAGVVGDDLALNAKQIMGVKVNRELPIVWAVAKGSLVNKAILVPAALLISYFTPWLVLPLLMLGGLYLCFEGVEKLLHKWLHPHDSKAEANTSTSESDAPAAANVADRSTPADDEKSKILGAIRTDFILSAEIIVIALGTVADTTPVMRALVLSSIAVLMTVGVYGLVAAILKLDDLGIWMQARGGESSSRKLQRKLGYSLVFVAPYLMRFLAIAGTVAMFLVGGGILVHGIPPFHHWIEHHLESVAHIAYVGPILHWLAGALVNLAVGIGAGLIVVLIENTGRRLFFRTPRSSH